MLMLICFVQWADYLPRRRTARLDQYPGVHPRQHLPLRCIRHNRFVEYLESNVADKTDSSRRILVRLRLHYDSRV